MRTASLVIYLILLTQESAFAQQNVAKVEGAENDIQTDGSEAIESNTSLEEQIESLVQAAAALRLDGAFEKARQIEAKIRQACRKRDPRLTQVNDLKRRSAESRFAGNRFDADMYDREADRILVDLESEFTINSAIIDPQPGLEPESLNEELRLELLRDHEVLSFMDQLDEIDALGDGIAGWRPRWPRKPPPSPFPDPRPRTPTTKISIKNTGPTNVWAAVSQTLGRGDPAWYHLPPGHTEKWSRHTFRRVTITTSTDAGRTVDARMTHEIAPEINKFETVDGSLKKK